MIAWHLSQFLKTSAISIIKQNDGRILLNILPKRMKSVVPSSCVQFSANDPANNLICWWPGDAKNQCIHRHHSQLPKTSAISIAKQNDGRILLNILPKRIQSVVPSSRAQFSAYDPADNLVYWWPDDARNHCINRRDDDKLIPRLISTYIFPRFGLEQVSDKLMTSISQW